jgi:hypothetical protein
MNHVQLEARLKEFPEQAYLADDTTAQQLVTHKIEVTLLVGQGFPPYKGVFEVMPLGPAPFILSKPFFMSHQPQIDYRYQRILPSS